jgi:hypothetical protein
MLVLTQNPLQFQKATAAITIASTTVTEYAYHQQC